MIRPFVPRRQLMELAIEEAYGGRAYGEHPVGAVMARGREVIAVSGNRTHRDLNPTHHAEMVVIGWAALELGHRNLNDCTLYTTHEPCPMCASASVFARLGGIVFGTTVEDAIGFQSAHLEVPWRSIAVPLDTIIAASDHPNVQVAGGFMRDDCLPLFNTLLNNGNTPAAA